MLDLKKHGIHITHNDADAIGCALVVAKMLEGLNLDFENNTYFCKIGDQDETLLNVLDEDIKNYNLPEYIIISDISLNEETCEYLNDLSIQEGIKILSIDHHGTNKMYEKYDWAYNYCEGMIDTRFNEKVNVSAAYGLMEYFERTLDIEPQKHLKVLIDMISRYDTWEWKNHPYKYEDAYSEIQEDVVSIVSKIIGIERTFNELLSYYRNIPVFINDNQAKLYPDLFQIIYDVEEENKNKYLSTIHNKIRVIPTISENIGFFIGTGKYENYVLEFISERYDKIDTLIIIYPSSNTISARMLDKPANLGELLSKLFGGGGHPRAAGARLSDEEICSVLEIFYLNGIQIDEYFK